MDANYQRFTAKKRDYPLTEQECYPTQPEAMFNPAQLREAYNYYTSKADIGNATAANLFNYLYRLEKDVTFGNQKVQP